jgi:hypothetical protein
MVALSSQNLNACKQVQNMYFLKLIRWQRPGFGHNGPWQRESHHQKTLLWYTIEDTAMMYE